MSRINLVEMVSNELIVSEGLTNCRKKYLDTNIVSEDLFNIIMGIDPTQQLKYVDWAFKHLYNDYKTADNTLELENRNLLNAIDLLRSALTTFDTGVSRKLIPKNDINQYKSIAELADATRDVDVSKSKKEKKKEDKYKETELVYEDADYIIVSPQSWESSKRWGVGTKWCITEEDSDQYWIQYVYSNRLKFYFVLNKRIDSRTDPVGKVAIGVDDYDTIQECFNAQDSRISDTAFLGILKNDGVPTDIFVHDGYEEMVAVDGENIISSLEETLQEELDATELKHTWVDFDRTGYEDPFYALTISFGIKITVPKELQKDCGDLIDMSDETDELVRTTISDYSSTFELDEYDQDNSGYSVAYYFNVEDGGDVKYLMEQVLQEATDLEGEYDSIVSSLLKGLDNDGILTNKEYSQYNIIFDELERADDDDTPFRSFKYLNFSPNASKISLRFKDLELFMATSYFEDLRSLSTDELQKQRQDVKDGFIKAILDFDAIKADNYDNNQELLKDILPEPDTTYTSHKQLSKKMVSILKDASLGIFYRNSLLHANSKSLNYEFEFSAGTDMDTVIAYFNGIDANYDKFREEVPDSINKSLKHNATYRVSNRYAENFDSLYDYYINNI